MPLGKMPLGSKWLDAWFLQKIESETKAIAQAERAGAVATAAMHNYGRQVLAEARRQLHYSQND